MNGIEDLIRGFDNIQINPVDQVENEVEEIINEENIMAVQAQAVNYQLLRLYIDTIPSFNGDPHVLEVFIDHCSYLINTYTNRQVADDPINQFLIRAVIGKLNGRALMLVGARPEVRTWDNIKELLRKSFGDQRNIDCLVQDLVIMKEYKNESPHAFGERIQKARSLVATKLASLNLPQNEMILKLNHYDELALKTFIRGLSGRMQDMIRLRQPNSLEQAISYSIEEENFLYAQRQPNQLTNNNFQKHMPTPPPKFNQSHNMTPRPQHFQNFQPHYAQNQQRYFTPQNHYYTNPNSQNSRFPTGPISMKFRQNMQPQRFLTNRQVFGPPKNVFKPTGQVPLEKPTPMSTTSRIPSIQRPVFPQNFNNGPNQFQNQPPQRNWISRELFNIEPENSQFDTDNYCEEASNYYPYQPEQDSYYNVRELTNGEMHAYSYVDEQAPAVLEQLPSNLENNAISYKDHQDAFQKQDITADSNFYSDSQCNNSI